MCSSCLVVFGAGQLCLAGTQAIRWVSKHSRLRVCLVVFSSCLVVFSLCLLVFGVCLVVCSGTWACDCVAKSAFSAFVCVQTQHCSTLNCVCLCLELCLDGGVPDARQPCRHQGAGPGAGRVSPTTVGRVSAVAGRVAEATPRQTDRQNVPLCFAVLQWNTQLCL